MDLPQVMDPASFQRMWGHLGTDAPPLPIDHPLQRSASTVAEIEGLEEIVVFQAEELAQYRAAAKIQAVTRGKNVRKTMAGAEEGVPPRSQLLAQYRAAAKIQAVARGENVRKTAPADEGAVILAGGDRGGGHTARPARRWSGRRH
jgi:hypothetical protein